MPSFRLFLGNRTAATAATPSGLNGASGGRKKKRKTLRKKLNYYSEFSPLDPVRPEIIYPVTDAEIEEENLEDELLIAAALQVLH